MAPTNFDDFLPTSPDQDDWLAVSFGLGISDGRMADKNRWGSPRHMMTSPPVESPTLSHGIRLIIEQVGASLYRDAVDRGAIEEVKRREGRIIDHAKNTLQCYATLGIADLIAPDGYTILAENKRPDDLTMVRCRKTGKNITVCKSAWMTARFTSWMKTAVTSKSISTVSSANFPPQPLRGLLSISN